MPCSTVCTALPGNIGTAEETMARARTETVKHKPAVKLDERVPKEFLLETLVNALFPTSKPKGPALNENSFLHFVVCEERSVRVRGEVRVR